MKNLKRGGSRIGKSLILSIIIFGLLIGAVFLSASHFKKVGSEQGVALTEQAIRKAVLQCYAIEGMYPSTIDYLEEHYSLKLDADKYYISYDCFASNIMPIISVFER